MCKPLMDIKGKTAQDLLSMCGQEKEIPLDLGKMLNKLNIFCVPRNFSSIVKQSTESIWGALATNGDSAVIYYNDSTDFDSHRCRFTIAHELGHCCLDSEEMDKNGSIFRLQFRQDLTSEDPEELKANIFAGELLIPEKSLNRVLDKTDMPSLKFIADIFDVSETVMRARLDYLKYSKPILGYNC